MGFAAGFAAGLAVGKKKFSGGGGDDWYPPDDWLEVPEPEPWEVCLLVDMQNTLTYQLSFGDPSNDAMTGCGHITIDWGDGTIDSYDGVIYDESGGSTGTPWSIPKHTYSEAGQYLIKVTTTEHNCLIIHLSDYYYSQKFSSALIAKLGENIRLELYEGNMQDGSFSGCVRLHWVVVKGATPLSYGCFQNCYALKKINLNAVMTTIPDYCFFGTYSLIRYPDFSQVLSVGSRAFYNAYALKKISLPNCASIGSYAFSYAMTLLEIDAPLCTSVGGNAFSYASSLEKATFADGCTFGSNAFYYCYNLYPRPDGSTN